MSILIPKTRYELEDMIDDAIQYHGNNCDLNHIDVSLIKNMSELFYYFKEFNGNISQWNVSNVHDMSSMFLRSQFNGDISQWDVSNVAEMTNIFKESCFNNDIDDWTPFSLWHPHLNSMLNNLMSKPRWFNVSKQELEVIYLTNKLKKELPEHTIQAKNKL